MKSAFTGIFLFIFALTAALAQQAPAATPAPQTNSATQTAPAKNASPSPPGKEAAPAKAPTPPDYSQEAYVVEHFSEIHALRERRHRSRRNGSPDQDRQRERRAGAGPVKDRLQRASDKLEIAYVRVRKPDGTVINAQESAIQDLTFPDAPVYTDYHEKHISVPSLRPGDVLEYRFVRTIVNPLTPGAVLDQLRLSERGRRTR